MKRLTMRKIREAVRLHASGMSTRKIAASLGVGQSTVSEYVKRVQLAGLTWPLPSDRRLRCSSRPAARHASSRTGRIGLRSTANCGGRG